ncbi:MAG: SPOR domain-containing protein [Methyloceanibacter sp.]
MADNRKDFRPRRLAFGGRFFPRACGLAAALAIAMASAAVLAEDAGLRNGAASLAAGKYDAAVRQLSSTINSDSAAPADAAMALYLRGIAYRKLGESARAIADLGAAIWLGLPAPDKIKAQVNRGLAYKSAGLSREGDAELAAARKAGGNVEALIAEGGGPPPNAAAIAAFSTEVRPEGQAASSESVAVRNEPAAPPTRTANASPGAWSTSVSDGQQPAASSSGNRLTRWFGSVTGSDSSAPAPPPEPAPAPQAATPPPPSNPAAPPPSAATASSSWSTTTDAQEAPASGGESKSRWSRLFDRSSDAAPQAQPAAAPSASGGGFQLQLATSQSEAEAKALWKKVSANVAGAQPQIEKVDIGNFGTFWSLRVGPFPDKAESLKVCNALKRSGIDCSPVTP